MTHDTSVIGPVGDGAATDVRPVPDGGLTVAEAAAVMGLNREALRQRIRRKKVKAHKIDGQWYVYPNMSQDLAHRLSHADSPIQSTKHVHNTVDYSVLVDQLRDEVAFLRDELRRKDELFQAEQDTRRREVQELHVLLQRAQAQIPVPAVSAQQANDSDEQLTTQAAHRRRWWWPFVSGR